MVGEAEGGGTVRAALVVDLETTTPELRAVGAQVQGLAAALDAHGVQAEVIELLRDGTAPGLPPGIDVVHGHGWRAARSAIRIGWPMGVPVVASMHGLGSLTPLRSDDLGPTVERLAAEHTIRNRADHLLADTAEELFELLALGASSAAVSVIPPAVDTGQFSPGLATKAALRPRVLLVGELEPWVQRALPSALAGAVAEVRACRSDMTPADRLDMLRHADVALCSDGSLAGATAALEAMACGVPVVAPRVGALADIVVDGVTGHLIDPHHAEHLADALGATLSDAANRVRLGEAGRARVAARFGYDRIVELTLDVYRQLVHRDVPAFSST
jgi:glycosyltransferase involved in cell wall biosynthesis